MRRVFIALALAFAANAVAALQCREVGARDGLPTEEELREFLA